LVSRETKQDFIGMNKKILLLFFLSTLFSQQSILLDEIAAVVDDEVVLLSDVVLAANALAAEENVDPFTNPSKYKELLLKSSESMIEQLVIIRMAEIDSVTVLEKDVDRALERQIQNIISQSGSEEAAEQVLGRKISDFKRSYKDDMEGKLIAEKYTGDLTRSIEITRPEVEDFFKTYKDSIPSFPKRHKVRHILVEIKPSEESSQKTELDALNILEEINEGLSFEEAAKKYSEDPGSKDNGGYLGFVPRGTFVKEFEKAAFTLNLNTISSPIKTQFGFHLIEVLERSGEKVSVRHILLRTEVSDEDKTKTYKTVSDLSKRISTKDNFILEAKEQSNDETTKDIGGLLGWINTDVYQVKELSAVINNIEENTCSAPILTDFGYHLLWVDDIEEGGPPTIEKNWIELEQMALNKKKSDWYNDWIAKIKTKVYIKRNPLNYPQIVN
jgi:peptidyl-prolyl cis-trans isomerase SurA